MHLRRNNEILLTGLTVINMIEIFHQSKQSAGSLTAKIGEYLIHVFVSSYFCLDL